MCQGTHILRSQRHSSIHSMWLLYLLVPGLGPSLTHLRTLRSQLWLCSGLLTSPSFWVELIALKTLLPVWILLTFLSTSSWLAVEFPISNFFLLHYFLSMEDHKIVLPQASTCFDNLQSTCGEPLTPNWARLFAFLACSVGSISRFRTTQFSRYCKCGVWYQPRD